MGGKETNMVPVPWLRTDGYGSGVGVGCSGSVFNCQPQEGEKGLNVVEDGCVDDDYHHRHQASDIHTAVVICQPENFYTLFLSHRINIFKTNKTSSATSIATTAISDRDYLFIFLLCPLLRVTYHRIFLSFLLLVFDSFDDEHWITLIVFLDTRCCIHPCES